MGERAATLRSLPDAQRLAIEPAIAGLSDAQIADVLAKTPDAVKMLRSRGMRTLRRLWAFPSLLRVADYARLLDESGFDLRVDEDRTTAMTPQMGAQPPDEDSWQRDFIGCYGEAKAARS